MTTELEIRTGLDALPATADKSTWTPEQSALMTSLGLKGVKKRNINGSWTEVPFEAPSSIVQAFLHQARTRRLDPLGRQIYCIERGGKWGIEASIDGFRLQAERSGEYLGQTPAQWTDGTRVKVPLREDGKILRDAAGNILMTEDYLWLDVWLGSAPPAAARIGILRSGFSEPMWAVATYAGYCPRDKEGNLKPTGQWAINPANQLLKCTEMLGLRKAFPSELSGLYGAEEMDQAGSPLAGAKSVEKGAQRPPAPASSPVQAPIVPPTATREWAEEIEATTTVEECGALYREAEQLGELRIVVGLAGDKDDGSPFTVMDLFWARKKELTAEPEPLVGEPAKPKRRQWVKEARVMTTRAEVQKLHQEAIASGVLVTVIEEIAAIEATLPDPGADAPLGDGEWASPESPVVDGAWVEVEPGVFAEPGAEQSMALADEGPEA